MISAGRSRLRKEDEYRGMVGPPGNLSPSSVYVNERLPLTDGLIAPDNVTRANPLSVASAI